MPRARSWHSTMRCRSGDMLERTLIRRQLDTEVREHRGRDIGDALDCRVHTDRQERHDGVALDERAVAPAARVMAAADVDELPALGRGDEELAGVRVCERLPGAVER